METSKIWDSGQGGRAARSVESSSRGYVIAAVEEIVGGVGEASQLFKYGEEPRWSGLAGKLLKKILGQEGGKEEWGWHYVIGRKSPVDQVSTCVHSSS